MQTATGIYFQEGELVTRRGQVSVYSMSGELFLEVGPGHNLWTLESEYTDYMIQLGDKPKGKCLEIGLGLGVASRCILTYPEVSTLTTVELRTDVIKAHDDVIHILDEKTEKWAPYDEDRHIIVNDDGLKYMLSTQERYDFVFMDFYKHIDEDTMPAIKDMIAAARVCLKARGTISGWLDPYTPIEYVNEFLGSFK
jgi:spermidine synthase